MNFKSAVPLIIATAFTVEAGESGLRSLAIDGNDDDSMGAFGLIETLGKCEGAKCGIWGDPHIESCDGSIYDCQGVGLFTLMKNFAFDVQANFVNVGALGYAQIKEKGWDLPLGATQTNDIVIDFLLDDDTDNPAPTLQFGFGDLSNHDGTFVGEAGCDEDWYYKKRIKHTSKARLSSVMLCRQACQAHPKCKAFTYWGDGNCDLVEKTSQYYKCDNKRWSRSVSGTMDSDCGKPPDSMQLEILEERMNAGKIGKECPLLMYVDGEMQELGDKVGNNVYLYGDENDAGLTVEVKKMGQLKGQAIEINYPMPDGSFAAMHLKARGNGPGELWGCHWDFFICLPESYSGNFSKTTTGLLGTPDGIASNEWMSPGHDPIEMFSGYYNTTQVHAAMMEYCLNNWCVSEEDSEIWTFHSGTTYEDYACKANPNATITDDTCVVGTEIIEEQCKDYPDETRYTCQMDCCYGGCGDTGDILDDLIKNNVTKAPTDPPEDDACDDLTGTSDEVCPSTPGGVVKLLNTIGTTAIPDGSDVFHSIVLGTDSGSGDTTVKFKITNPFDFATNAYVKHDVSVLTTFTNSVCNGYQLDGCDTSDEIEVVCKNFPGVEPFALVNVYYASAALDDSDNSDIDECCNAEEEPDTNRVEYTFQIECTCPGDNTQ